MNRWVMGRRDRQSAVGLRRRTTAPAHHAFAAEFMRPARKFEESGCANWRGQPPCGFTSKCRLRRQVERGIEAGTQTCFSAQGYQGSAGARNGIVVDGYRAKDDPRRENGPRPHARMEDTSVRFIRPGAPWRVGRGLCPDILVLWRVAEI